MKRRAFLRICAGLFLLALSLNACGKNESNNPVAPTQPTPPSPPVFKLAWGDSYGSGDDQLAQPMGIATDNSGNVYVADSQNNRVQKFTESGVFIATLFRDPITAPVDVECDLNGNIWVLLTDGIRKFAPNGDSLAAIGFGWGSGPGQFKRRDM